MWGSFAHDTSTVVGVAKPKGIAPLKVTATSRAPNPSKGAAIASWRGSGGGSSGSAGSSAATPLNLVSMPMKSSKSANVSVGMLNIARSPSKSTCVQSVALGVPLEAHRQSALPPTMVAPSGTAIAAVWSTAASSDAVSSTSSVRAASAPASAAAARDGAFGRPPASRSVPTPTDAPWAFAEDEAGFEFRVPESTLLEEMGLVKALEGLDAIRARRKALEAWARDESVLPAGPAGLLICTRANGQADEYDVAEVLDVRRAADGKIELEMRGPAEWRPLTRWLSLEYVSDVPNEKLADTAQIAAWRHLKGGTISRLSCGAVTSHAQRLRRCIQAARLRDERAERALLNYDFDYDAGDSRLLSDLGFLPALSALESLHLRQPQLFAWSSSLPHEASLLLPDGPKGLLVKAEQPYVSGQASSRSVVCEVVLADARSRRLTVKGPANWRPLERQISFDEVLDEPLREEDLRQAWLQLRSRHLSDVELRHAQSIAEKLRRGKQHLRTMGPPQMPTQPPPSQPPFLLPALQPPQPVPAGYPPGFQGFTPSGRLLPLVTDTAPASHSGHFSPAPELAVQPPLGFGGGSIAFPSRSLSRSLSADAMRPAGVVPVVPRSQSSGSNSADPRLARLLPLEPAVESAQAILGVGIVEVVEPRTNSGSVGSATAAGNTGINQWETRASGGRPPPPPHMDTETEAKLDQWVNAKRAKDFATADRLREEMRAAGAEPDMVRPAVTSPSRPACRFYRSGTCSRGAGCLFSHAEPADAPRRARSPSISPPRRREPPRDLPPRGDGSSSRFVRDYERDEPPRRGDYATWRHERREEPPRERRRRSRSRSPDREARRRRYGSRSPERDTSRRRYDY